MDTILYANDMPLGKIAQLTLHQTAIEEAPDWLPAHDEGSSQDSRHFRPGVTALEIRITEPTAFAYTLQVAAIYVFIMGDLFPAITQRQGGKVVALETSPDAVTMFIQPALAQAGPHPYLF